MDYSNNVGRRGSPVHKLHKFSDEGLQQYYDHIAEYNTEAKEKNLDDVVKETQLYLDEIIHEGTKRQLEIA
jgi:hypothetical protein